MIIDIHTHCFPDELAKRAIPTLEEKAGSPAFTDGTVSGLKASMKISGVSKSVIMPIATKPQQTTSVNRWAVSIQDDSILSFGSIHPDYENWEEEMDLLVSADIKGIKLHPDYQEFFVDDEKVFPIYESAASKGLIILFHAGIDIGIPDPVHCTPERLRKVAENFPNLKIIAAHMGGFKCWDDVMNYLVGTRVYFDTSYSYDYLGVAKMKNIISAHGTDKILFGSDSPWSAQDKDVRDIESLNLASDDYEKIMCKNALNLLD